MEVKGCSYILLKLLAGDFFIDIDDIYCFSGTQVCRYRCMKTYMSISSILSKKLSNPRCKYLK